MAAPKRPDVLLHALALLARQGLRPRVHLLGDGPQLASQRALAERLGDDRLRVYLYHIPPVSQVPITLALIDRLLGEAPQ